MKPLSKAPKLENFKAAYIYKDSIYRKISSPTSVVKTPLLFVEDGVWIAFIYSRDY